MSFHMTVNGVFVFLPKRRVLRQETLWLKVIGLSGLHSNLKSYCIDIRVILYIIPKAWVSIDFGRNGRLWGTHNKARDAKTGRLRFSSVSRARWSQIVLAWCRKGSAESWRQISSEIDKPYNFSDRPRLWKDGSNLVDPASSICLTWRLSHACLSISYIWRNCEWLIKTVIIYLMIFLHG